MRSIHHMKPVAEIIGYFLVALAVAMIFPLAVDLHMGNRDWTSFLTTGGITGFIGGLLIFLNLGSAQHLRVREGFILTTLSWVVIPAFAALPFMFSSLRLDFTDAFFEAMSGLSSCGATILPDPAKAPPGILLWRAILNFGGGVGIIVMAMSLMTVLRVGGMQLFRMESSDKSEKLFSSTTTFAKATFITYSAMTLMCFVALMLAGVGWFDAICHAMAAMATGGFGNYSDNIKHFNSVAVEVILTITMTASCLPFVLYIRAFQGDFRSFFTDSQVWVFLGILWASILSVALWLNLHEKLPFLLALRYASFNITSVMSTCGFSSDNYAAWGTFPEMVLLLLSMIGGCTGSTAGAIKIFRLQVVYLYFKKQARAVFSPNCVYQMTLGGKPINSDVLHSVMTFICMYVGFFVVFVLLVSMDGLDLLTAASGVASSMAAAGYGLGPIINPTGSYEPIPVFSKWVLSFAMMFGRLEFMTFLVLISPLYWKD
jgi:trk system potassium uptake protein